MCLSNQVKLIMVRTIQRSIRNLLLKERINNKFYMSQMSQMSQMYIKLKEIAPKFYKAETEV